MPEAVKQHIEQLKAQGAHIIYGIDERLAAELPSPSHEDASWA